MLTATSSDALAMPDNHSLDPSSNNHTSLTEVDGWLRRLAPHLPGVVRYRLLNALDHFDRSSRLFEVDREMASFRAITGEEEAATALMKAIQLRRYPHASEFNPRDHQHKFAVMACVRAIGTQVSPVLKEFQLTVDFGERRFDVKVPLSNFNVAGGENYAIQPVEPLDVVHHTDSAAEGSPFERSLKNLAAKSSYDNIRKMVSAQANGRNTLLYASDSALPASKATMEHIANRKSLGLTVLVLSVMVLQSRKHQALVCQAIVSFLGVIARLPRPEITEA